MSTEEWFEMRDHKSGKITGYIPRSVAEDLGVNCRPADRKPQQGTIWFTVEQSKAIHKHALWRQATSDHPESPVIGIGGYDISLVTAGSP